MIVAFSEFISDVAGLGRYPFSQIAEDCGAPGDDDAIRAPDIWQTGWVGVLSHFSKSLTLCDESFCRDEEDLVTAASVVLRVFGESRGYRGEEALAAGCRILERTVEDYAALYYRMWRANEAAVLFGTRQSRSGIHRIGVVASAPITPAFYDRFRAGGLDDMDIQEEDLLPRSRHLLLTALADDHVPGGLKRGPRSMGMVTSGMMQTACLVPQLYMQEETRIQLIGIEGTPTNGSRAASFGFTRVGTHTRQQASIIEFPSEDDLGMLRRSDVFARYLAMKAVLILFQSAHMARQAEDEAAVLDY
jgi:hypothetical protein